MSEVLLVISNFPDHASAEFAAGVLIADKLAACANILPVCMSIYRWEGKVEQTSETPLLLKTTLVAYPRLESALRELHPYEIPEIIAIPVTAGLPAYLAWVAQETQVRMNE